MIEWFWLDLIVLLISLFYSIWCVVLLFVYACCGIFALLFVGLPTCLLLLKVFGWLDCCFSFVACCLVCLIRISLLLVVCLRACSFGCFDVLGVVYCIIGLIC